MAISGVGTSISPLLQSVLDIDHQLQDLQRQLATGEKSDTFDGLGSQAGVTVGLNAQLSAITGYDDTITNVGTSINLAQTVLSQIAGVTSSVKAATVAPSFDVDGTGQTSAQKTARDQLDQMLGALNTQGADGYLFSGTGTDQPSVETTDHILNGNGSQAGLKQLIAERNQADLAFDGLGRLVIPAAAGATVSVSEDVAGSPFGLKLAGVASALTGAAVTGPAGSPAAISVDLSSGNPKAGDSITYTLSLPDGSTEKLTLTATNATPPGADQFTIGATPAATAQNLQATLQASVRRLVQTALPAASAMAAANDFFSDPPQRVAGGAPFYAATALVAGTAANTVSWYTGENGAGTPRSTALARIDPNIAVQYGTRANEQAIRWIVQNVAVLAATSYAPGDANASASYAALNSRIGTALGIPAGVQGISDIQASLGSAQSAMQDAKSRHAQTQQALTDMLQQIQGVSNAEVGSQILALQTSLSASLSTTARLSQLSLLNYLAPA